MLGVEVEIEGRRGLNQTLMEKEGKALKTSGTKTKIETGNEDHQNCQEIQGNQGKVIEIGNLYTITEKRDLDIIDCKMIEVVGANFLVSSKEGKMSSGSMEKVGILREENLAEAGHLLVRSGHIVYCAGESSDWVILNVSIAFCVYSIHHTYQN
jgi:hypothetical protein